MDRREFVTAALATGGALLPMSASAADSQNAGQGRSMDKTSEYYELRRYHLRRGPGQQVVDAYLKDAALPAWQRAGAGPIGVFTVMIGANSPSFYVVIPHKTLDAFAAMPERLVGGAGCTEAAAGHQ